MKDQLQGVAEIMGINHCTLPQKSQYSYITTVAHYRSNCFEIDSVIAVL
jgi:hypothetical protein